MPSGIPCPRCHGDGVVDVTPWWRSPAVEPDEDECPACDGTGRIRHETMLDLYPSARLAPDALDRALHS